MKRLTPVLIAALALCATASAADGDTLAVVASSHAPHARGVALALTLRYEMRCGYPGAAPLVVALPGTVPQTLSRSSVLVDGRAATGVSVSGRKVTVSMPARPQILCNAITMGTLKVAFKTSANLANPLRAGTYQVGATKGALAFLALFRVR